MIARGMSHVSFPVRDLARSLAFYRDVLGFAEMPRPALGVPGAWLRAGDAEVHLIAGVEGLPLGAATPAAEPGGASRRVPHRRLPGRRLTACARTISRCSRPAPRSGQMWVQDPDGHVIELIAVTR